MSWKTEVLVEGKWASNALRFATEQEALDAGVELLSRWFVPADYRAVESTDPVNAEQRDPRSRAIHIHATTQAIVDDTGRMENLLAGDQIPAGGPVVLSES